MWVRLLKQVHFRREILNLFCMVRMSLDVVSDERTLAVSDRCQISNLDVCMWFVKTRLDIQSTFKDLDVTFLTVFRY